MKMVVKIIDLTTLVLGLILGTRIVLMVLGANPDTPFVKWIYLSLSNPLMAPFTGIFPTPAFGTNGIIDIPAFFALVVYLAGGYMISAGLDSISRNMHFNNILRLTAKKEEKPAEK